jgi:hypothetical protein
LGIAAEVTTLVAPQTSDRPRMSSEILYRGPAICCGVALIELGRPIETRSVLLAPAAKTADCLDPAIWA